MYDEDFSFIPSRIRFILVNEKIIYIIVTYYKKISIYLQQITALSFKTSESDWGNLHFGDCLLFFTQKEIVGNSSFTARNDKMKC